MEFVFIAPFFLMMLVGIVAAGNLYFTHNAMVEATRRGARYAFLPFLYDEDGLPR